MTTKDTLTGRTDFDVTDDPWTDPDGNEWLVSLEWKVNGDQLDVAGIAIRALGDTSPTATLIRKVPFGRIINAERARLVDRGEERPEVGEPEAVEEPGAPGEPGDPDRVARSSDS